MKKWRWYSLLLLLECFFCIPVQGYVNGTLTTEFELYRGDGFSSEAVAAFAASPRNILKSTSKCIVSTKNGVIQLGAPGSAEFRLPMKNPAVLAGIFRAEKSGEAWLGVGADWWFECYVNGKLIYSTMRDGNGAEPISPKNHIFPVPVKQGDNRVVFYVLSGSEGWSIALQAFSDSEMQIRFQPKLPHPPWLTHPDLGRMTVNFITPAPMVAFVDYREAGSRAEWSRAASLYGGQVRNDLSEHAIVLKNLKEDTCYEYRVVLSPEPWSGKEFYSPHQIFRSFGKQAQRFKAFYTSDTQISPAKRVKLLSDFIRNCGAVDADLFIHGGDVDNAFDVAEPLMIGSFTDVVGNKNSISIPLVVVRGNHEYRGDASCSFLRYFGGTESRSYYGFRKGNTCFVVLDTGEDKPRVANNRLYVRTYDTALMKEQRAWLTKFVKSDTFQKAKFRIVLAHSPGWGEKYMNDSVKTITDGIFTGDAPSEKIHLWLCGHTHRYARTRQPFSNEQRVFAKQHALPFPSNIPFIYLVNDGPGGGGGGPDFSAVTLSIDENAIEIKSMMRDGKIFDHFAIFPDGAVREYGTELITAVPGK